MSTTSAVERKVWESRTLDQLLPSVRAVPGVSGVAYDTDVISFKYRDKDGDLLTAGITEVDEQRIEVLLVLPVPEDNVIASLVSVNEWNGAPFAHGTFSYHGTGSGGKDAVVLESHLLLIGGVTEENIRDWLANFIGQINHWEEVVLGKWRQIPNDTNLLKGGSHPIRDALASGAGEGIIKGIIEALLGGGSS